MTANRLVLAGVAAVVVLVALLVGRDSSSDYQVRLNLDNASGLREGSRVTIGGAAVGKVSDLSIGSDDKVRATLELDDGNTIGSGASASIRATNLLATKFVDVVPGDMSRPAPSGTVIPNGRVERSVDIDQVIDVLDADTRTRLGILINEAGRAFTGRRADFNKLVGRLPATLEDADRLLSEVSSDRRTLGRLLESSDRFLAALDPERKQLGHLLESAGDTMTTLSARRAQLRTTLRNAPGALASLRAFLVELRKTAAPLGPAARAISDTSPGLAATLRELAPFEKNARPTLRAARATAPALTKLGTEATPVIRDAAPTLRALTRLARHMPAISRPLARGGTGGVQNRTSPSIIDDLLATATSWASGASDRDVGGHIFHGIVNISPDTLLDAVQAWSKAITPSAPRGRRRGGKTPTSPAPPPQTAPAPSAGQAPAKKPLTPKLPELLPKVLDDVLPGGRRDSVPDLLDFLLEP